MHFEIQIVNFHHIIFNMKAIIKSFQNAIESGKSKDILNEYTIILGDSIEEAGRELQQKDKLISSLRNELEELKNQNSQFNKKQDSPDKEGKLSRIFLKSGSGIRITCDIDLNSTVEDLKHMIQKREGILPKNIILVYLGRVLDDENTLRSYTIKDKSIINFIYRFRS